ncbi:hypothetical protein [Nakamurella alba]|uniref:hypothetical protein n=1 Tax=Nakamurella alba TaxID=2665158 RepID=UPI0038993C43
MHIQYRTDVDRLGPAALTGFFVGWPAPPSPATLLEVLQGSSHRIIAVADGPGGARGAAPHRVPNGWSGS